jgi:hypothetical protein
LANSGSADSTNATALRRIDQICPTAAGTNVGLVGRSVGFMVFFLNKGCIKMTNPPERQDDEGHQEADRQADAMKAQLRKDVDSWSKARSEPSTALITEAEPSVTRKPPSSPPASKPRKAATPKPAPNEVGISKKPFSMSYGGVTAAEYIQYMLDRGLR